jgi:hypothetical protein
VDGFDDSLEIVAGWNYLKATAVISAIDNLNGFIWAIV